MPVVTEGLEEFRRAVSRAATRVEAELRATALRTAERIQAGMQTRVRVATGATRAAIRIVQGNGQVRVEVGPIPGRNALVPMWLEYGTSHTPAAPFATPAMDAERSNYPRDGEAACARALQELA